ncbi:MAG: flagellar FlbD family protein [Candidatus Rokubacteria bacterium]|nr:flagellar FlbD family protein [Candidatus Rokubacteria bacterium]
MITLTAVNGVRFSVRAELIESVEDEPATTVALTTGLRLQVRESPATVRELMETAHSRGRPHASKSRGTRHGSAE